MAAATILSFSARGQCRRRCTDVITSTCALVIGLALGLAPGLDQTPHPRKAVLTGCVPINYSLKRWTELTRFLDDGRLCMTNNAAERELRAVAVGRRNWTFAGSDEGGRRAAALYTLIGTAKLNDIDPKAWLADMLARLPDHPAKRVHELLPWHWRLQRTIPAQAAA